MLVFWKQNLVFLAVPKTGTTAIEGALAPKAAMVMRDPPQIKHAPVYRYRRFFKPLFVQAGGKEPEIMAVVRDPVDWLGSWYRYRSRDDLIGHPNSTRDISFDDFVLEYCKGKPADFANVGSQAKFVLDGDGNMGIDHLFRYEDQSLLIAFLEARLDVTLDLKRLNVSPSKPTPLSPAVAARLREKRSIEFEVWDMAGRQSLI
ncbi:sulfotransferase family protein [Loktanella sp. TSTF-M6]|uniref:Sulfotransferase family protein n=1 Tax=Loktanella gaetbuli TaxID=2881335 RepID=A0ABS8BPQ3_9RHOB|nr:sulfotransferase family protein [Loktanella gaetbuli]MCB5197709.1 sulfotransferase family protein [Loktanella gaetbuli]